MITNCHTSSSSLSSLDVSLISRKRDRERSSPTDTPPSKTFKSNHKESRQNGRHSYNKVSTKQPSSSSNSFVSIVQVGSSNVSEKHPSKEVITTNNNAQIEENNNDNNFLKDIAGEKMSAQIKLPYTPQDICSTVEVVSPTLLSPISASDSPLGALDGSMHLTPVPLSPISPCNSPPFKEDLFIDIPTFQKLDDIGDIVINNNNESIEESANNLLVKSATNTLHGVPSNNRNSSDVQLNADCKLTPTCPINTPSSYPQTASNLQRPRDDTCNYQQSQHISSNNAEMRIPPPYSSIQSKFVNNNQGKINPHKNRYSSPFPKQYRQSLNYDYPLHKPPLYQAQTYRGPRNINPRHPPPRYPIRIAPNRPVPVQLENTYTQIPQNGESQIHYVASMPQMSYNAYQVTPPPPTMPNINVPPPVYGLYPGYYGGYMYPSEMYQQVGVFGGVTQPPLPTDAPPASEIPPPPPPE